MPKNAQIIFPQNRTFIFMNETRPGVNFINVQGAAFMLVDPKSVKQS